MNFFLRKKNSHFICLGLLFLIFFFFISFLAIKLRMGLSPDSYYHLRVSQAYSTTLAIPPNTPDTYQWRDITRIPYLYFWINGRLLNINKGIIDEVLLLRLVNVLYSSITILVGYLLSKEFLKGKWERILPVFLLTNTLMFVFLSSSINYDNLANLFCILSLYFFVKFVKSKQDIKFLLLMFLSLALGSFTKFTVLPLAFILVILSFIDIFKRKYQFQISLLKKYWYLIILLLIAVFFNIQVYGINILKYGSLEPSCTQILTHEQCLENGVYYRDNITRRPVQIEGVGQIVEMIFNGERIDFVRYFGYWVWNITGKIFGIMADSSLYMPEYFKIPYLLFFSIAIVLGVKYRKRWDKVDYYLITITLFYISILFFVQNYTKYLRFNHFYLALQGRYVFPVIIPLFILFSKSLLFVRKKWLRYLILIPLLLLFAYSCIPFFLLNVPSSWY